MNAHKGGSYDPPLAFAGRGHFTRLARLFTAHARGSIIHSIMKSDEIDIPQEWLAEFEAARRPLEQRMRYAFIRTYKPVLDDVRYRSFDLTEDYRRWREENLPDWLGYGRV